MLLAEYVSISRRKFEEKSVILLTEFWDACTFLRHYFVLLLCVPPKTKRIYLAMLQKFEVSSGRKENNVNLTLVFRN